MMMIVIMMMIASFTDDDAYRTQMMAVVIVIMISSYTDDDDHIIHRWWWLSSWWWSNRTLREGIRWKKSFTFGQQSLPPLVSLPSPIPGFSPPPLTGWTRPAGGCTWGTLPALVTTCPSCLAWGLKCKSCDLIFAIWLLIRHHFQQ